MNGLTLKLKEFEEFEESAKVTTLSWEHATLEGVLGLKQLNQNLGLKKGNHSLRLVCEFLIGEEVELQLSTQEQASW